MSRLQDECSYIHANSVRQITIGRVHALNDYACQTTLVLAMGGLK